jgi:peptidoglycan-N-acetylglucosamine deacetylase
MIMAFAHRAPLALCVALLALMMAALPVLAGSAIVVRHGDRTTKTIALTFDDGWSAKRTAEIVGILDRHGVKATFLPYAKVVRQSPALWRSIAKRYPIANHTVSHPKLVRLTSAQIYDEIDRARRIVEQVTGRKMVRIFRAPYGSYDSRVLRQAYRAGFKYHVLWDVDSGDTARISDARVLKLAVSGRKGSIVLMHAGPGVTVRVLAKVIRNYKSRGFRFVTLPEMLGLSWAPAK